MTTTSPIRRRLVLGLAFVAVFNLGFFARPFIDAAREPDAIGVLENTARIHQSGVSGAPRVFVTFDPYCRHCHKLYEALVRRVETGEVQVEWVPVAFMNADSASVGGELLAAADPYIALSRWFGAEPGTSPVVPRGANPKAAEARVARNTEILRGLVGRNVAPAVFYRDREGVTQLTIGMPADFEAWLKSVST